MKYKIRRNLRHTGFSVIELIVVVSIIALVSALIFANLPRLGRNEKLDTAVQDIYNTALEARSKAVSIEQYNGTFPSYGIYFNVSGANADKIILYADCKEDDNGDGIINNADNFTFVAGSNNCGVGDDGLVESISLPSRIRVSAIRSVVQETTPVSETSASIEYLRPEPSIWLFGAVQGVLDYGRIEIDVTDAPSGGTKTIRFWNSGLVQIK